jgi:hypothetical protein
MISTVEEFLEQMAKVREIPNRRAQALKSYGKVRDLMPTILDEAAKALFQAEKEAVEARIRKFEELKAPECILENERKRLLPTFEVWLKRSKAGCAFRKIHGMEA